MRGSNVQQLSGTVITIYMITSVLYRAVRAVRSLPDVRGCGAASLDLTRHKGRTHYGGAIIIITRSEAESTIA